MDQRVEVHGTSRADVNGKHGVAADFHPMGGPYEPSTWRYTVKLDSGESFKLKPSNLRASEGTYEHPLKAKGMAGKGRSS